jgi:uncharacterized membrane protein YGL010W
MKSLDQWFSEYGESHQNPTNKAIHKICVPTIMFSLLGMLWLIPTPEVFASVPYLNWATLFVLGCMVFYITLSLKFAFAVFFEVGLMLWGVYYVVTTATFNHLYFFLGVFIVAWIGQFIGHKIEGKKPSFFQDLQFLLIGPLWVLKAMGIKN